MSENGPQQIHYLLYFCVSGLLKTKVPIYFRELFCLRFMTSEVRKYYEMV